MCFYYVGILNDQGRLWEETLADDPATETDARQGGLTPTKISPRFYHDIMVQLDRLIAKADQLLDNETTNLAESWMHIRTKFDGGKVINRSQSGSWELRCMGVGLRQNNGLEWALRSWEDMAEGSPNKVFIDTAKSFAKTHANDKKRKSSTQAKETRRKKKYSQTTDNSTAARRAYNRRDGGISPDEVIDDISTEELKRRMSHFYREEVCITRQRASIIEEETRTQATDDNQMWEQERRKRVTASKVGCITKMRKSTKRSKKSGRITVYNIQRQQSNPVWQ